VGEQQSLSASAPLKSRVAALQQIKGANKPVLDYLLKGVPVSFYQIEVAAKSPRAPAPPRTMKESLRASLLGTLDAEVEEESE
jgi:hypothetical protein